VDYIGDIGYAFINGKMIHDNFCNDDTWELDLMPYREEVIKHGLYIYISPQKKGSKVHSDSEMAARFESSEEQIADIYGIEAVGIYDASIVITDK
jgi:hypothetical protein